MKSPNIDRLAERGVLFERAYCNQAVCAPSRNALMTGLRPQSLGIYDLGTNFRKSVPDAVTLAAAFQAHGYRTEALGKIFHVGHGNHEDEASWSVPHWRPQAVGYALPENAATKKTAAKATRRGAPREQARQLPRGAATESADVADDAYGDGQIADEAIRRLQRREGQARASRFFLAVGFLKPHLPFCRAEEILGPLRPAAFPLPRSADAAAGRARVRADDLG